MNDEKKTLMRSRTDRKLLGVAGGLAEYFNTDSSLVRLIFIALFLLGSAGLWAYLIAALVMPLNPSEDAVVREKRLYRSRKNAKLFGVAGGLAEYLNADTTLVRLIVVLCCIFCIGLPLYVIAAIILPIAPEEG